ncbi:MAG: sensor domain-containing diguanylate cyclase [Clostridiaceae bacterium]|nr:sensor domain-containing diguanylate cyclase [Clostridiaceae bacterium]
MKRHTQIISSLIIIFSIIIGFAAIVYKDTRAYQELAEKHLENVLSLIDIDISNHIGNSITKPVMVSKTMANDEFLKKWLLNEPENFGEPAYLKQLYGYLDAYKEKYGYTTVFCVSEKTGNYYYQEGLNKTISKNDEHDIWYYNFTESHNEFDLEVDTNEANGNNITIFVNFRVESSDKELLGVIGVGLQVNIIEDTIRSYESNYDISAYIINVGGSENSFAGNTDIFISKDELAQRTGIKEQIDFSKSDAPKMQWFTSGRERKCLISQYNETLRWYLVLEKDTNSMRSAFEERIKNNISFMLISLVACIIVTTTVFINYNEHVITMENTDELTGLPNRKLFSTEYSSFIRKHPNPRKTLFMFDIDHFKNINDTHGHMFGNAILAMVGNELRNTVKDYGIAARWGGDEFLGILTVPPEEAEKIFRQYMTTLKHEEKDKYSDVTISVGLSEVNEKLSMEQMVKKVDEMMYCSKEGGRNRISLEP